MCWSSRVGWAPGPMRDCPSRRAPTSRRSGSSSTRPWPAGTASARRALEAQRSAVRPRIRSAAKAARLLHPDAVRVAEEVVPLLAHLHVVPPRGELPRQRGRIAPFHAERARGHPPGPPVEPARRLHAGLRAKPAKEAAGEQRGYRLGLTLAAHGPQRGARPSARKIQSGGERVQRALAGRERIDVARIEAEEGATVLQHD